MEVKSEQNEYYEVNNYFRDKCQVLNCNETIHKFLLCKNHFDFYVVDKHSHKIARLLTIYYEERPNWYQIIYIIFLQIKHFVNGTKTPYIDIFPFETLFYYYYINRVHKIANCDENFYRKLITDFDYENNFRNEILKYEYLDKSYVAPAYRFSKYTDVKSTLKFIVYIILLLIGWFGIWLATYLKLVLFNGNFLTNIFVVSFLSFPIIYFGKKSDQYFKNLIQDAAKERLFNTAEENKNFIRRANKIVYGISLSNNARFISIFMILVLLFITNIKFGNKSYLDLSSNEIFLSCFLWLIGVNLLWQIFATIWNNIFPLISSQLLYDYKITIDLYALDRNLGINNLKSYLRSIFVFNIFVIILGFYIYTIGFTASFYDNTVLAICGVMMSIWNAYSLYNVIKVINYIKVDFDLVVADQKQILEKSNSISRFIKYQFIDSINLNILFNLKTVKQLFLSVTALSAKILYDNLDEIILIFNRLL